MKHFLLMIVAAAALCVPGAADDLTCKLTGKPVSSCCCEKAQNGKLHCKLADKDVKKCCCAHKM